MNLEQLAHDIANGYRQGLGAPSRIAEPDTVQQVLEALQDGNYMETAAELAGLSKQTIYHWLKLGEQGQEPYKLFADAAKRACARAEAEAVKNVRNAGKDPRFWAAEMTFLERRHPEKFGRRSEGNSGPAVLVQIGAGADQVQIAVVAPQALSPSAAELPSLSPRLTVDSVAVSDERESD